MSESGAKVQLFLKLANFLEEIFIKNNQPPTKLICKWLKDK